MPLLQTPTKLVVYNPMLTPEPTLKLSNSPSAPPPTTPTAEPSLPAANSAGDNKAASTQIPRLHRQAASHSTAHHEWEWIGSNVSLEIMA